MHKNKINGKVYIGQTCHGENPKLRWGSSGQGYIKQPKFYKDIVKYGWENFDHIILEDKLSYEEVNEKEAYYINLYSSIDENKGYNKDPGNGGVSEATRQAMSNNWHEKSKERCEFVSNFIKEYNKNRIYPTGPDHPRYNDHTKVGENAFRKRSVQCIETGEIFPTLTLASQWCNPNGSNLKSHIREQILGKRNYCGKHPITKEKLHWRYINENENE